ncbi:hypothetical protein EPO44_05360 [bacterium]|nr:MAG: hypothetical protein EPO44_05360 [bacterium]
MNFECLVTYPLLEALKRRRSRRFALGMKMNKGPLAYQSRHKPFPLTEEEEAALAFAACGITGYALGDLPYAEGDGGTIMAGFLGRTVASGDAIQTVALVVTNDQATYLIKRPQDFTQAEIPELIRLAGRGELAELYRRGRVKIKNGRAAPPLAPMFNINVNHWSLYAPATTYFLPINELTFMYINGLLEVFNETTGAFIVDERASFRPAGIGRFARSKGGHLKDDPKDGCIVTVQRLELMVSEVVTIEQGMMLQNLGLMAQAMGLGGFPNFAEHDHGWFQALGFRMGEMPASRYLGATRLVGSMMRLLGRDVPIPYPLGLEHAGTILLKPYCPPYYPSMAAAVRAVVETKFGPRGIFRGGIDSSSWREPGAVSKEISEISEAAIQATIAYCSYIYDRYGRFPVYLPPFRTVTGFQASHLDIEFYDRFYRPEALSETQREHMAKWHGQART